ncbi:MAG: hypothetical protein GXO78_08120 [Calditrichaeota bacterium]|nr:hypothetical protein [Calditrichota bacterium]
MARLEDKQVLLVVGQKNYDDEELNQLLPRLEEEGADVFVASNRLEKALGRLGGYVTPDLAIEEAQAGDYHAIVLLGGYGARVYLWNDAATHKLVQEAAQLGKILAASSIAPVVLANAGVLRGKKATVFPDYNSAIILREKGAELVHEDVVIDDNIITSNHHQVIAEFTEALMEKLEQIE